MKLVDRLSSIGKTSSSQLLNAKNKYRVVRVLELNTCTTYRGGHAEKSEWQDVELSMSSIVKGYHNCCFEENTGQLFTACKKRGERV